MANVSYPENWIKDLTRFLDANFSPNNNAQISVWQDAKEYTDVASWYAGSKRIEQMSYDTWLMLSYTHKVNHFLDFISASGTVDVRVCYDHYAHLEPEKWGYFGLLCVGAYTGLVMLRADGTISSHT